MRKEFEPTNFDELKKLAYQAAVVGKKDYYNKDWEDNFINCYAPDIPVFHFERVIGVYRNFLAKGITEEEGRIKLATMEKQYISDCESVDKIFKFMLAEDRAFKENGIEYGEIDFSCPICEGVALASRKYTPGNLDKVQRRSFCTGCGLTGRISD